ncbi:MAG: IS3 family transposase [endosymbiont of Escarpia spicata]|uniref:IS3 family transposase n=1 Tax=endosymbiont of Escarpia spicata TaxID=2200908 RepID=A0A370DTC5_9GAMM|nr:MAG: IS3 family transposase [endosymbiont of Escarpia spicata]
MPRYSEERKASVMRKLLPPNNRSVPEVAKEEGISEPTLYNWRNQAKEQGIPVPGSGKQTEEWSPEAKFAAVVETATMSELEISEYSRSKGLYPEQIERWKEACIQGAQLSVEQQQHRRLEAKQNKKRIKDLERELHRKEKALAEAAALLVLRKKFECPLGGRRGRVTSYPERQERVKWIGEAVASGARKALACEEAGITIRTLQRWTQDGDIGEDQRSKAQRPEPGNKLSEQERRKIVETCNQPKYASLPPSQIVPMLADKGEYLASESSFYRVLQEAGQLNHRGRSKAKQRRQPPTTHIAQSANEVWSWDISYLPSSVRGQYFYLYLIMDIYSRKIVGWEVHDCEGGEEAAALIQRTVLAEHCFRKPLVLHADNGSPMKSQTMRIKLYDLGIIASHSRPRVSNDNPYSESLFRTLKYCPQWPSHGFESVQAARKWVSQLVRWYNEEHHHSQIRFVTPAQRHMGEDVAILAKRDQVYTQAKKKNPSRWSGETRNWAPVASVALNPERDNGELAQAA